MSISSGSTKCHRQPSLKGRTELADLKRSGQVRTLSRASVSGSLFPFGLGETLLHEIADNAYGDRAAATAFLIAALGQRPHKMWVWIQQASIARDAGDVLEGALLPSSHSRLSIHARNAREALWAAEEAIVSSAASLVVAEIEAADFTATRRLALASGRYGVPVVLLLTHTCQGATAADARWRVGPRPSANNRYDPSAPGHPRWRAVIERCRSLPSIVGQAFDLEWNNETLSLRVAPGLVIGPAAPRPAPDATSHLRKAG